MKISPLQIAALGGVGIAAYWVWQGVAAGQKAAQAINPLNPNNAIAHGFDEFGIAVGAIDKGSSLGSTIYDWFHPEYDPNREARQSGIGGPPL